MTAAFDQRLIKEQHNRLRVLGTRQCVDMHCHCLPAFDDGPRDLSESLDLCMALVRQGITTAVASPHQLGRFDGCNGTKQIRQGVETLNDALVGQGIPLTVLPGAEIRVDERLLDMVLEDRVMTLADAHKYLLLELPYEAFFDLGPLLHGLREMGLTTVLAHPERNAVLAANPSWVLNWAEYSPVLQVTASSLIGRFGPVCERAAWAFLDMALWCVVATDAHDNALRAPVFADAYQAVVSKRGLACAREVCLDNPRALVSGREAREVLGIRADVARWTRERRMWVIGKQADG